MIEKTILKHLIQNEDYAKKVLPFLKIKYFHDPAEKRLFMEVKDFILTYNKPPEFPILELELQTAKGTSEEALKKSLELLENIKKDTTTVNKDWLVDSTEKFCQEKSIYNAMLESMEILEGKNQKKGKGAIPDILSQALAVSFDPNIGHDYFADTNKQFDFYHKIENRIKFDVDLFNKITDGGLPEKTMTVGLGGVGTGKTMMMCSFAAGYLALGYDVLYITLEMAAEAIIHRIDANLLNCNLKDVKILPKEEYIRKAELMKNKTTGTLIVKEYPTGAAGAMHFKALLDDLRLKKSFKPAIIFVDYINLCESSRLKPGSTNSYGYIKAIAEELRGIAVEYKTRMFTATQVNRQGYNSSSPDLTNTAESFGLPATADLMFAIVTNEELEKMGQLLIIQLKNRFNDMNFYKNFVVGVDRNKMRIFDAEASAQKGLIDVDKGLVQNKPKDGKNFEDIKW